MKVLGVIPARYGSTRFPGKPLAMIGDKTMIHRTYLQAVKSSLDAVVVATDDVRIFDEDAAAEAFSASSGVIADPMYAPVCPPEVPFHRLPHEAFSGRCYRKESLNLIDRPLPWRF